MQLKRQLPPEQSQKTRDFVIRCSLEQVFKNIEETETIKFAQEKIAENPEIKSESMGLLLADQFSRKWTPASQKRYGNAMILWVKYLNNLTQMQVSCQIQD